MDPGHEGSGYTTDPTVTLVAIDGEGYGDILQTPFIDALDTSVYGKISFKRIANTRIANAEAFKLFLRITDPDPPFSTSRTMVVMNYKFPISAFRFTMNGSKVNSKIISVQDAGSYDEPNASAPYFGTYYGEFDIYNLIIQGGIHAADQATYNDNSKMNDCDVWRTVYDFANWSGHTTDDIWFTNSWNFPAIAPQTNLISIYCTSNDSLTSPQIAVRSQYQRDYWRNATSVSPEPGANSNYYLNHTLSSTVDGRDLTGSTIVNSLDISVPSYGIQVGNLSGFIDDITQYKINGGSPISIATPLDITNAVNYVSNGSGGTAHSHLTGDRVTSIDIDNNGSGYTVPPRISIPSGATAVSRLKGYADFVKVTTRGTGYASGTTTIVGHDKFGNTGTLVFTPTISSGQITAISVSGGNDAFIGWIPASATTSVSSGTVNTTITDRGYGYISAPFVTITDGIHTVHPASHIDSKGRVTSVDSIAFAGTTATVTFAAVETITITSSAGGNGATAELYIRYDKLYDIEVTNGGSGYGGAPAVTVEDTKVINIEPVINFYDGRTNTWLNNIQSDLTIRYFITQNLYSDLLEYDDSLNNFTSSNARNKVFIERNNNIIGSSISSISSFVAGSGYTPGSYTINVPDGLGGILNYHISVGGSIDSASVNTPGIEYNGAGSVSVPGGVGGKLNYNVTGTLGDHKIITNGRFDTHIVMGGTLESSVYYTNSDLTTFSQTFSILINSWKMKPSYTNTDVIRTRESIFTDQQLFPTEILFVQTRTNFVPVTNTSATPTANDDLYKTLTTCRQLVSDITTSSVTIPVNIYFSKQIYLQSDFVTLSSLAKKYVTPCYPNYNVADLDYIFYSDSFSRFADSVNRSFSNYFLRNSVSAPPATTVICSVELDYSSTPYQTTTQTETMKNSKSLTLVVETPYGGDPSQFYLGNGITSRVYSLQYNNGITTTSRVQATTKSFIHPTLSKTCTLVESSVGSEYYYTLSINNNVPLEGNTYSDNTLNFTYNDGVDILTIAQPVTTNGFSATGWTDLNTSVFAVPTVSGIETYIPSFDLTKYLSIYYYKTNKTTSEDLIRNPFNSTLDKFFYRLFQYMITGPLGHVPAGVGDSYDNLHNPEVDFSSSKCRRSGRPEHFGKRHKVCVYKDLETSPSFWATNKLMRTPIMLNMDYRYTLPRNNKNGLPQSLLDLIASEDELIVDKLLFRFFIGDIRMSARITYYSNDFHQISNCSAAMINYSGFTWFDNNGTYTSGYNNVFLANTILTSKLFTHLSSSNATCKQFINSMNTHYTDIAGGIIGNYKNYLASTWNQSSKEFSDWFVARVNHIKAVTLILSPTATLNQFITAYNSMY